MGAGTRLPDPSGSESAPETRCGTVNVSPPSKDAAKYWWNANRDGACRVSYQLTPSTPSPLTATAGWNCWTSGDSGGATGRGSFQVEPRSSVQEITTRGSPCE